MYDRRGKKNGQRSQNLKKQIYNEFSEDEEEEDFDSLFEQETVYRQSKMLAHITYKASFQGPG